MKIRFETELFVIESSECVSPPPIQQKASVLQLKPFVFSALQDEIRVEKFRCVKLIYALFTH